MILVQLTIDSDLIYKWFKVLILMLWVFVVTYYAIEKVDVKRLIGIIWFKYNDSAIPLIDNDILLKSLMKISEHLFHFLYDFHINVAFEFDYAVW